MAIEFAMTLIKIALYDEPEGATLLVADAMLAVLLLVARRATLGRSVGHAPLLSSVRAAAET